MDGLQSEVQVDVLINLANGGYNSDFESVPAFEIASSTVLNPGAVRGAAGTFMTGHFLGNATTDLAYVFEERNGSENRVSIDVYEEAYLSGANQNQPALVVFSNIRWMTTKGTWHVPTATFTGDPANWTQTPTSQWIVGDFTGNGVDSIANAWLREDDGKARVGLSTFTVVVDSSSNTFAYEDVPMVGYGGSSGPGDWGTHGWWAAGDMDGDGRTDLIYAFREGDDDSGYYVSLDTYVARSASAVPFNKLRAATNIGSWKDTGTFLAGRFVTSLAPPNPFLPPGILTDIATVYDNDGITSSAYQSIGWPLELCGPGYNEPPGGSIGGPPVNGACL